MYAQVLVFRPIKLKQSPFLDYHVPDEIAPELRPGILVVVPLRTQVLPGIVMSLSETASVEETRDVKSVLTPEPALTPTHLRLARWMAHETLAPLHMCVKVMLPPGLRPRAYLRLSPLVGEVPPDLPPPAELLLRHLVNNGVQKSTQIRRALRGIDLRRARYYLKRKGYIEVERLLRLPRVQPKTVRMARLTLPPDQWEAALAGLRLVDLYRAILTFLASEEDAVEVNVIRAETGGELYHLKMLEKRGAITFSHREVMRDPLSDMIFTPDTPPTLTPDQDAVWQEIMAILDGRAPWAPVLLLGVTGSGKTELYMRATAQVRERGQQTLMLVPEISLTPQTVRRFAVRFPGEVGLWHSGMSDGERYDTWRRVRDGDISIVVGARSALFAPFDDLGLIVMDEEEDTSYKQGRTPYYHTRETAEELARITGALLLMGSATPLVRGVRPVSGGTLPAAEIAVAHPRSPAPDRRLAADAQSAA